MSRQRLHLVGYASACLGLGEILRRMARALAHDPQALAVHDFRRNMDDRAVDDSLWALLPEACFDRPIAAGDRVLYLVNPDQLAGAIAQFPATEKRCTMWFWELERLPDAWKQAFEWVDEIWTPTQFVHQAVVSAANDLSWPGRVRHVRLPLDQQRTDDGNPPQVPWWPCWASPASYRYYFSFDCHSVPERKNPFDLIRAFRIAFGDIPRQQQRQPRLLLRVLHPDRRPDCLVELNRLAAGDPRIIIDSGFLTAQSLSALIQSIDVYVSLHRSEGLGLGMAEAMSQKKVCIATGWSGNLDFMQTPHADFTAPPLHTISVSSTDSRSSPASNHAPLAILLRPRLCKVPQGAYPHADNLRWAHVEIAEAAQAMRWCFDFPAQAALIGKAAARSMAKHFSDRSFANWIHCGLG